MTIQEKIDSVVELVQDALGRCGELTVEDRGNVLNGVLELGYEWQEANAHARAMTILMGLNETRMQPHLMEQFVDECVELKQYDELKNKEMAGNYKAFKMISMSKYSELIDMLMVEAIEGGACEYQERDLFTDPDGVTVKEPDGVTAEDPDGVTVKEPDGVTAEDPDGAAVEEPETRAADGQ